MNIPNSLSIFRILLIPCYVGLLVYGRFDDALIVFIFAGLTDALDGGIARWMNQHTRLGAILDPLADKLLLTSGFITLSSISLVPLWATILVVSRDIILMLGAAVAHVAESPVDLSPTWLGKSTTFLQLCYVVLVIFLTSHHVDFIVMPFLLIGMAFLTLLSGLHYLYRGYRFTSAPTRET